MRCQASFDRSVPHLTFSDERERDPQCQEGKEPPLREEEEGAPIHEPLHAQVGEECNQGGDRQALQVQCDGDP